MTTEEEIYHVVDPYTDRAIDSRPSPKSLRKLVRKAKQGNEQAQDRLCSLYVATVKSIYNDPLVKYLLGDDAVGIVWELFLTLIQNYTGNDFKHFPGLVKTYLLKRIKNKFRKPGSYKAMVTAASDTLDSIPKQDKELATLHEDAGFYSLLAGCTKKQKQIAKMIYMYAFEKSYAADALHINRVSLQKADAKILAKARCNYYKRQSIDKI